MLKYWRLSFIICLWLMVFTIDLPAQPVDIEFERFSIHDGLSQNSVTCIFQDSPGFIWLGTLNGLNRYDGYRFAIFRHNPEDSTSLSGNHITAIYETAHNGKRILWIGTANGLNRFDPHSQRFARYVHEPENPHRLPHNRINAILQDRYGSLWIATDGGLSIMTHDAAGKGEFVNYVYEPGNPNSLSDNRVYSIYQEQDSSDAVFWVGSAGGLDRIVFPVNSAGSTEPGGAPEYRRATITRFRHEADHPTSLSHNEVRSLWGSKSEDGEVLWIGTYGGGLNKLVLRDENGAAPETTQFIRYQSEPGNPNSLSDDNVLSVKGDGSGKLWIGTFGGGLNCFDPQNERFTHYKRDPMNPNSLSSNVIYDVYLDRSGALWFGTDGGGFCRWDKHRTKFRHFTEEPGNPNSLSNHFVKAFYEDASGNMWIGTGDGLNRFEFRGSSGKPYFNVYKHQPGNPHSLLHDIIFSIYKDPRPNRGDLLIGTMQGLCQLSFSPASGKNSDERVYFSDFKNHPLFPATLKHKIVYSMLQDHRGDLWFGTEDGLYLLRGEGFGKENFITFRHDSSNAFSLSDNYVRRIVEDSRGNLWICTRKGLNRFDPGSNRFIRFLHNPENPNSISHNNVVTLYEDTLRGQGTLWIATENGLNRFDPENNRFRHFWQEDGLPDNMVLEIRGDRRGKLWISTNYGLCRFDPVSESFHTFDLSDGLQSLEFNYNASFLDSKGRMYFGGVNGFNLFYPDSMNLQIPLAPVVLTDLKIFNKSVPVGGKDSPLKESITVTDALTLSYRQNVFSFEYAALNFAPQEKNRYLYQMVGFNEDWIEAGTNRIATFTNLDPGEYVFRVKTAHDTSDAYVASLKLIITPPPWKTWWAYSLYALLAIAGLLMWRQHEINKLRRREAERRRREQEAAELREAELRAESAEYRAQVLEAKQEAEKQQIRNRIARDLHDEIGSNLSSLSLIGEVMRKHPGLDEEAREAFEDVNQASRHSIEALRDIVWFINPMSDSLSDLAGRMQETANSMLSPLEHRLRIDLQDSGQKINPDVKRNVYLIFKEALNNIIRHSQASQVNIELRTEGKRLILSISDNGIGFDKERVKKGNGLSNLRSRAEQINGQLTIQSEPSRGTRISLSVNIT